ncbi:MAG: NAD(P)H-dependent oxidoreductase [Bdellovibrionales bacterium]
MSPDQVIHSLNWRYATKKFDSTKKIKENDWHTLSESLRLAPSSYGLQPWKFLVVQDKEKLKKLTPLSWNQTQVEDCSHYIVFTTLLKVSEDHVKKFINKTAEVRGVDPKTMQGYQDMMIGDVVKGPRSEIAKWWAQRQSYIAMGFLMETAALLKIDTCAMEGIDPSGYDKVLGLEGTGWGTVAAVACGYRHPDDKYQNMKKVRFDTPDIIQFV